MRYLALLAAAVVWAVTAAAQSLLVPVIAQRPIVLGSVPQVNWANPITQGSAFGWVTIGGLQYDLVNSQYGTFSGSGPVSGYYGAATTLAGSSGPAISEGRAAISTSIPSTGLGDFAMMVLANPAASGSTSSRGMAQSVNNQNFTTPEATIDFNADQFGTVHSGIFAFSTYDGSGGSCSGSPYGAQSNASAIDGNFHLFGGQRVGSAYSTKLDGIDDTNSEGGSLCDVRENYIGVGVYGDGSQGAATASFVISWAWNRGLSTNEWVSLGRNPLQLISYPVQDQLANMVTIGPAAASGSLLFKPF